MPLFIIALVAMHYLRRKKVLSVNELKTEYSLWICTIAVGCYIPIYILDWVFRFYTTYNSFVLFLIFLEYTLSLIATPGPIFILYYLLKWNKHFKMAYDITFKASVRTYGADNLDDASDNEDIVGDETDKNVQSNSNGTDTTTIMVP
ncbi:hypothetical protein HHI36_008187 [Cryptolaemus montrouzieri]|uniref:Uncharacterized protein n=1 Tax=Cryptolaemus montrouzieri TaxID=559131 RepID=A0ABD2MSA5_9CUCU